MNQTFSLKHSTVAIVSSAWHRDIVASATAAIREEFRKLPDPPADVHHFEVPGAFEIPLHAKRLARSARYDAIIACGFVVNGGIYRHEFVASAVIDGLMRVQLETEVARACAATLASLGRLQAAGA